MAALSSGKCDILLEQLQRGQTQLRRSLRILNRSTDDGRAQTRGEKRKFPVVRRERALGGVRDLPRKRARLVQLSPDWEEPHAAPTPPPHRHHLRRLSSTPKHLSVEPPPSLDVSLEDAIFENRAGTEGEPPKGALTARPRERVSKVVVDTYRSLRGPPEMMSRKPQNRSQKKQICSKKRGLTVSFVQDQSDNEDRENDRTLEEQRLYHESTKDGSKRQQRLLQEESAIQQKSSLANDSSLEQSLLQSVAKSRSRRRDGYTEPTVSRHPPPSRGLEGRLIDTLNASRFGALDSHLAHSRKRRKFPRARYAGGDPALGYDWIAGLLDSESYLNRHDDDGFFSDIKEFRRVNQSECVQQKEALLPGSVQGEVPYDQNSSEICNHDDESSHNATCVSSFVLNDRLFPVPLHPRSEGGAEECPVCLERPQPDASPTRYIRVSVPRCALLPAARLKAHRRRSFDPTDSMAIRQHCLAGWESAQPSGVPPEPGAGLSSSLKASPPQKTRSSHKRTKQLMNTSLSLLYSNQQQQQ